MLTPQKPKPKPIPVHRRGDSLRIPCLALDASGQPCNLNIRDLAAQLRDAHTDALINNFTIVKGDAAGLFFIQTHYSETAQWPLTAVVFDIQETLQDVRTSSEAVRLDITKDVTYDH